MSRIFSGEPLPLPPRVDNAELAVFHRKLIDYLRRLAGLLTRYVDPEGGPGTPSDSTIPVVVCYIDANQDLEASYTGIDWTNTIWIDGEAFNHSGEFISVVEDGLYLIHCDIELNSGFYETTMVVEVSAPDGSSVFYPRMGYGKLNNGTFSLAMTIPLVAGRRFQVLVRCVDAPETNGILAEGTRITVLRLRNNLDGPNSGEGWTDGDGDGIPPWGIAQL